MQIIIYKPGIDLLRCRSNQPSLEIFMTDFAPKSITPADLEASISEEYSLNLGSVLGFHSGHPTNLMTMHVLVLKNGYTVTGRSACVDPRKYDAALGAELARKNAIEQLWPLLGFLLAEHQSGALTLQGK